ncbi:MAG: Flp pilus assembly complex ATPase component TadA [Acidobacteria bacterium]|nr:Flp pilus assembly complex ATPase component TadA [Acidobacteriota bacterium]
MNEHPTAPGRTTELPDLVRHERECETIQDSAPVVHIQTSIFEEAANLDASDVHIEPRPSVTVVRYRINGLMKDAFEVPRWLHENLVVRIKILAGLDISERRVPQDGHIAATSPGAPDIRVYVPQETGHFRRRGLLL